MRDLTNDASRWWSEAMTRLRATGHPLTAQREAVVQHLAGATHHPSAADVCNALPEASRSTVYKTLSLLVDLGVADAVPAPSGELRFDPRTDDHDHFYCTQCNGLSDIPHGAVTVQVPEGFTVSRQRVVVEGICGTCASRP